MFGLATAMIPRAADPIEPQPPRQPSLKEQIAVRRLAAHDAAVAHNAAAKLQCERAHVAHRITFGALYGTAPVTPGPAFGDMRVGGEWVRTPGQFSIRDVERSFIGNEVIEVHATVADGRPPYCDPHDDPDVFCPFHCTDDAVADCGDLAGQLDRVWGPSWEAVWHDHARGVRASVRVTPDCELRFQREVPARAWIARTSTAEIPLALIGASISKLPPYAEESYPDENYHRYTWTLAVTGDHIRDASIEVDTQYERIVRIIVDGTLDEDGGADEIHALVRPFLGPQVTLTTATGRFELTVGRLPLSSRDE